MPSQVSEIDSQAFFLSPNGKYDAKAELLATLHNLLYEKRFDDNATACLYPARTAWLREQLDLKNLPQVHCNAYKKLLKKVEPRSVTLIFPNAHIKSPASMFGHTFLRLDGPFKSKLLSFAVNYSADANKQSENGALYAIKGIFGGYPGYYSMLAYTDKLKEYRDSDRRDIWEYDLNLNPDEVLRMFQHIWELKRSYAYYYFFDENCSYNMLWLIEVARSGVHLRNHFSYFVSPPATIQAMYEEHLITKQHYRPSKRTVLLSYEQLLGTKKIALSDNIALSKAPIEEALNYPLQDQRYILEAASLLLEYYYLNGKIKASVYKKHLYDILTLRSKLGKSKDVPIIQTENPDDAHKTSRITLAGLYEGRRVGLLLSVRPAYHNLDDSNDGFLDGIAIEFFNLRLKYLDHNLSLQKFALVSVKSYIPFSSLFQEVSYEMAAGWSENSYLQDAQFSTDLGAGVTLKNSLGLYYALATLSGYIGGMFEANYSASTGVKVGYISKYSRDVQTNVEYDYSLYKNYFHQNRVHVAQHYRLEKNLEFSLSYEYREKVKTLQRSYMIDFNYYF